MSDTDPQARRKERHALVLAGGGARAAYQVGCLRYIARAIPDYRPGILTGISAGAINAAHLAAYRGTWADAVTKLCDLWMRLDTHNVYRTELRHLLYRVVSWGLRLMSGGYLGSSDLRGMVDNAPLETFLRNNLPLDGDRILGIDKNLRDGLLEALAIVTTDYATGQSVAWVEAQRDDLWERGQLDARPTHMRLQQVMASSALPFFFPAVRLDHNWHGDGGVRLLAPLSPALHLGATRILAVSPRKKPEFPELGVLPEDPRYPSPAQIAGVLLNAVFLDSLDYDALQMNRITRLVADQPPDTRAGMRPVEVMVLRPTADLGKIAREHEYHLPRAFRYFERGASDKSMKSADALSMVNFEPEYIALLLRLGEEDAEERGDAIKAFLRGDGL